MKQTPIKDLYADRESLTQLEQFMCDIETIANTEVGSFYFSVEHRADTGRIFVHNKQADRDLLGANICLRVESGNLLGHDGFLTYMVLPSFYYMLLQIRTASFENNSTLTDIPEINLYPALETDVLENLYTLAGAMAAYWKPKAIA